MKSFPPAVFVGFTGQLTPTTKPLILVNPLSYPSNLTDVRAFRFNKHPAAQIGIISTQVAEGVGLLPGPKVDEKRDIVDLIFTIRAYVGVMNYLECGYAGDYAYQPVERNLLTGEVNAETCIILCSLVHDVFGTTLGDAQADMLSSVIKLPPHTITIREQPDPNHHDIIAAGPICDEGEDKWRIVLRHFPKAEPDKFVVHTQFFPQDGAKSYFENGNYCPNYLQAVRKFTERVLERATSQYHYDEHRKVK